MSFAKGPGGARIHYEVHGDGERTVVLLHGLGLSSRFWFDQPHRLTTGPDPWRVVTIDNRGVGRSDRPFGSYAMPTMADDVASVLDHAGLDRAFVAGISLGGMIAQHVALRHPRRVEGLVLLGTSAGFPHMSLPSVRCLVSFLALPFDGRLRRSDVAESFARLLLSEKDVARADDLLAGWPAALSTDRTPMRVYVSHLASAVLHSTGFRLRQISCPTVVVVGDDDSLLPNDNSRLIARLVPRAHLEVVAGAGHMIPASHPECVRQALVRAKAMGEVSPHLAINRTGPHATASPAGS